MALPTRKYDKGEKRLKHQGRGPKPEFRVYTNDPKRIEGLCPATMSQQLREALLNEAIAAPNGDREAEYIKYLYAVHEGAIYEARTSDAGQTYHGFPYRGILGKVIVDKLRVKAEEKKCLQEFNRWVKDYITVQG